MKTTDQHKREQQIIFNPDKPRPLTPELLRSSSGMHDLTDKQAEEIIDSLYTLSRILLTAGLPERTSEADSQQTKIIPLHPFSEQNIAA